MVKVVIFVMCFLTSIFIKSMNTSLDRKGGVIRPRA